MFILRIIDRENDEMNLSLGDSYNVVDRFSNYDHFCRCYKLHFGNNHIADLDESSDDISKNIFRFITYGPYGETLQPINLKHQNYIMTDSGKTFCRLT